MPSKAAILVPLSLSSLAIGDPCCAVSPTTGDNYRRLHALPGAAHRVRFQILKSWVAVGAALILAGACGALPQPFRDTPKVTTDNPLLDVPTAVGIAVLPVRGAPQPMATQISTAVAMRLQSFEIPAEAVPENHGLGFTLEAEARPTDSATGDISLVVTWILRSRRGAPMRTYRQVVTIAPALWEKGDADTANRLGNEAALAIGDMVNAIAPPAQGPIMAETPPPPIFPTISVKPVDGAPGDGRESLRLAVLQSLINNGVKRDDIDPDIVVTCELKSSTYDSSLQKVEILWRAIDRGGKELGTVKLDNTIPIGALDGPWGPTAFAIAEAALNDLLTLLASHAPKPQGP